MEKRRFVSESESALKATSPSYRSTLSTKDYRKKDSADNCRPEDHELAHLYNFDHPSALDFDLAYEKINELL